MAPSILSWEPTISTSVTKNRLNVASSNACNNWVTRSLWNRCPLLRNAYFRRSINLTALPYSYETRKRSPSLHLERDRSVRLEPTIRVRHVPQQADLIPRNVPPSVVLRSATEGLPSRSLFPVHSTLHEQAHPTT